MKLENQVVSLELAKKLKSLNVKQESLFYHEVHAGSEQYLGLNRIVSTKSKNHYVDTYSAFTVAELGELLPMLMYWGIERHSNDWRAGKLGNDKEMYASGDTMANTLAKMLIYLLENKLTQP